MSRKIFAILLVSLLLILLVSVAQAGKSYYAERFNVQLDLQPDGDMIITETVVFRFEGGPFTYAFRHISAERTDGLTFLEASMDGIAMPQGTQAGQVEVQTGDPLKVTWHFSPTSNSMHTFVVRYRVTGVVSTGGADILRWYVIPPDHGYPISQSTIWLNVPPNVQPLKSPSLDRAFSVTATATGFELTTSGIGANEGVILTAEFPANSLVSAMPKWQVREQERRAALLNALPVGLLSGLATLLLGGLGIFAYVQAHRRELNLPPMNPLPTPPDDRLSPALVGKLMGQENYTALGALLDLAQRGVFRIREEKSRWGAKYLLEWINQAEPLHPFEQGIFQLIFKPGESQADLGKVLLRLSSKRKRFEEPIEQELVRRGWLDPQRKRERTVLKVTGVIALVVGLVLCIVGIFVLVFFATIGQLVGWIGAALAGFGGGVFLLSSLLIVYASYYSPLTPTGEEQKMHWKSFWTYLNRMIAGQEPAMRPDVFERYLAYAVIFGLGEAWARYFEKMSGVSLPSWFHSLSGAFSSMGNFLSYTDIGSSSGGGDGGGASGGGSSGAG
ncbi:MAG: DUF2207 domain-containing protein [Anaerolineales bacterium]|nr:DUF2207 domain-containing protein [Anaerolineales bacterium]MDW8161514.1 DUF2207 domain-containing protein [Anaerolineales bacterium]